MGDRYWDATETTLDMATLHADKRVHVCVHDKGNYLASLQTDRTMRNKHS